MYIYLSHSNVKKKDMKQGRLYHNIQYYQVRVRDRRENNSNGSTYYSYSMHIYIYYKLYA